MCHILQRMPDVPPKTPMIPAHIEFKEGFEYTYKDENDLPRMVPQFDPVFEDFVDKHVIRMIERRNSRSFYIKITSRTFLNPTRSVGPLDFVKPWSAK